jgi:hypothetical protein
MQKFASTLHLSKQFMLLNAILLSGSLAVVYYLPLAGLIKVVLSGILLSYTGYIFHKQMYWRSIKQDANGWWLCSKGHAFKAKISGDSTVTSYVTILRFTVPGAYWKQSCIIFKDAMQSDVYRQLVLRLRFFDAEK